MSKRKKSIKKDSKSSRPAGRKAPAPLTPISKVERVETAAPSVTVTQPKKNWLAWLDEHILLFVSGFLFAFIPLYPKIPLAELIPGYIVRLRLEDIFIGLALIIYAIQIVRKKAEWKTPFTWIILGYAVVGLLSTLSAMFITKTVPLHYLHVLKTLLHYFRYLEYFSVFFIAYSAIKTQKHFLIMMAVFGLTVTGISLYGYGQKFLYWPLYSTMNREFSKGIKLYLTPHARVQSTFGGHYDLGGYMALALPLLLSLLLLIKSWKWRIALFGSYTVGLWLLIMSASRASFVGFVVAVGIVLLMISLQQPTWLKKIWWGISRGTLVSLMLIYMFVAFGESIRERFYQTIQSNPTALMVYQTLDDTRGKIISGEFAQLVARYMPKGTPPENGHGVTAEEQDNTHPNVPVLVDSDTRPATQPADVYVNVPETEIISSTSATGVVTTTTIEKDRVYSENALKYGLSMAIRLDTLWPQAIRGFQRNPLVGSGYATLTKTNIGDFTEAESTDNNFLRTLGETGLLGFITFYGTIVIAVIICAKVLLHRPTRLNRAVAVGFIAGSVALLINALYIDVYASSKVAFTYWALTGFVVAYFMRELEQKSIKLSNDQAQSVLPKPNQ